MRYLKNLTLVVLLLAVVGCGGGSDKPLTPLSEEQKRKIVEEDLRVADEESGGTAGKPKKAGKRRDEARTDFWANGA